ncbi:MAG: xanthine dehydrogenase accessory protein XdhC [Pseudomonadota bacterium]
MSEWLAAMPGDWLSGACELLGANEPVVRITIVAMLGSAPREAGASLLVTPTRLVGSIGGGQLEWQAIAGARALLQDSAAPPVQLRDYTLGPDLNQCCGGRVQLWFERLGTADLAELLTARQALTEHGALSLVTDACDGRVTRTLDIPSHGTAATLRCQRRSAGVTLFENLARCLPPLWIFGAGHVGQALLRLFADLPLFEVTCIDSRAELLPHSLPAHLHVRHHDSPLECIAQASAGTRFLVMTHDHSLDFELCRALLLRGDFAWLGLIGSDSKRARFRSRLVRAGLPHERIDRLCCPIGIGGLHSKLPAAIAVSVVAQLLLQIESAQHSRKTTIAVAVNDCGTDCAECTTPQRAAAAP